VRADGSEPRPIFANCHCQGGAVHWSPSGDEIAFGVSRPFGNPLPSGTFAAGPRDAELLYLYGSLDAGDVLLGWATDDTVYTHAYPDIYELELRLNPNRIDHGPLPEDMNPYGLVISPDGTRAAQMISQEPRGFTHISTTAFPESSGLTLVANVSAAGQLWWSPDGTALGYLIAQAGESQGIWLVNDDGSEHRQLVSSPLMLTRYANQDATSPRYWQPRP